MANDTYVVLSDALTVHKAVGELRDGQGNVTGHQLGQGKVVVKDTVLSADEIAPSWVEALDDSEHPLHESISSKLAKSGDDPHVPLAQQYGLPFEGYDDAEEDDVLAAMRVLPSSAVQAIKAYERDHENRDRIVHYNIGFGQSPDDRAEGLVGGGYQEENPDKKSAKISTREVPEEGTVQHGEGITGTGEPEVLPGTANAEEEEETEKSGPRQRPRNRSQRKASGFTPKKTGDADSPDKEDDK